MKKKLKKGNDFVKQTTKLLQECVAIDSIGYVEGDAIYQGVADIVICDGFVGNVMLKASEGLAGLLKFYIKETFHQNLLYKCLGYILSPLLKASLRHIDPARYNGASFFQDCKELSSKVTAVECIAFCQCHSRSNSRS